VYRISRSPESEYKTAWSSGILWIVLQNFSVEKSVLNIGQRNLVRFPLDLCVTGVLIVSRQRSVGNPLYIHRENTITPERPIRISPNTSIFAGVHMLWCA